MGSVLEANASDWEQEVLQSDMLTLVDFWHDRCPWCAKLNPIFNQVAEEYKKEIKFVKLNVLETSANREIAIHHGIMSTPTLMFFCDGRPVGQYLGFMHQERLKKILDDMLENHKKCLKQSTQLNP